MNKRIRHARRRGFCAAAAACLFTAAGAAGQTTVRWTDPVTGEFTDPARWSGPVPAGAEYDPVIDAAGVGTARYYVRTPNSATFTTGHLTVAAANAQLVVERSLNAVRGVDLTAGHISLHHDTRLEAPFVNVAPGGNLVFDSNNPVWLSVGTLRGTAHVRAPLQVERDLSLDNGTLQIERHGATFLNGSKISGTGTVLFAPDSEGYLRPAAAAVLEIGSGITVASTHTAFYNNGRVENAVNYGTFVSDAARRGNLSLTGTNHGTLRGAAGGGVINFSGTNGAAGVITADGTGAASATAWPQLSLQNVTNHGTITANRARVALRDGLTNTGAVRLTDTMLSLHGTFTTATVGQIERVGGSVRVDGTLDNRDSVINLDTFGPLDFGERSTLLGGRVAGSDASAPRLTFTGPNYVTLQGVTFDVPVVLDSGGPLQIRDGITVNRELTFDYRRNLFFLNSGTLGGTGRVTMVGGSDAGILQAAGTTLTIGPGMTVRATGAGANYVGSYHASDPAGHVSMINRGHVVASANSAVTMNGTNWKNEGVITLEAGAMLNLGGKFDFADLGTVNRDTTGRVNIATEMDITGRTLDLSTSPVGPLDLGSSYFAGGRLESPGRTVEVRRTDSRRDGLVVNGTTLALDLDLVGSGILMAWQNDVILDGATVRIKGGNSRVTSSQVVGTGEIVFDAAAVGWPGPRLETARVEPGVTVRTGASGGQLVHHSNFVNEGRVVAETAGKMILSESQFTNRGAIEARNGGAVVLWGGGSNYGTIRASDGGAIAIGNGRQQPFVNHAGFAVEPSGFLDLSGTLSGTGADLRGTIRPNGTGIGTGTLALESPVVFSPTSALAVQLRGSSSADRLDVDGQVLLDGTLRVGSDRGLPILPDRSFEVLRFGSREGDFDSIVNETGYAGLLLAAEYDADSLTLTTDALDGDANLDGRVDTKDLLIVRRNMRRTNRDWLSGDFDGNRRVNAIDMHLVRRNLGADLSDLTRLTGPAALGSAGAVPEPAAPASLLLASVALLRRRRSKQAAGDRASRE